MNFVVLSIWSDLMCIDIESCVIDILFVCNVPLNIMHSEQIGDEEYDNCWYKIKLKETDVISVICAIYDTDPDESVRTW